MPEVDLTKQLAALAASDRAALARLGQELAAQAADAPRAVVREWAHGRDESAGKAALVALPLDELALAGLLDEAGAAPLGRRIGLLDGAVAAAALVRDQILLHLDAQLLDESPCEPAAARRGQRVCDRAYVLIVRLLELAGQCEANLPGSAEFEALSQAERDEVLLRWRASHTRAAIHATTDRYG